MTMQKYAVTKPIIAAVGLVVVAGLVAPAHAASAHLPQHAKRHHRQPAQSAVAERREGAWQPRDSGALPFGSARWRQQMLREGRVNGDTM
jgi:uncharacterized protein with FMN-binding domain